MDTYLETIKTPLRESLQAGDYGKASALIDGIIKIAYDDQVDAICAAAQPLDSAAINVAVAEARLKIEQAQRP